MSNKIFFNLDNLFISVGIDVGADFSWMSIALPNQQFVGHLIHTIPDSLHPLSYCSLYLKHFSAVPKPWLFHTQPQ